MPTTKDNQYLQPWSQALYRIQIEGNLEDSWSDRFAGMRVKTRKRADQSVVTDLTGPVIDQAELLGVLNGLAELHLPILLVECISRTKTEEVTNRNSV